MKRESKMKLFVLAHNLTVAGGLSVGQNFINGLRVVRPKWHYLFVVPSGCGYENLVYPEHSEVIYFKNKWGGGGRLFFDLVILRRLVNRYQPHRILCLGNIGFANTTSKQAILFHKPQMIYPEKHYCNETIMGKLKNKAIKYKIKQCLKNTQLVFCQTQTAKKRFAITFNYNGIIKLCPNAVSEFTKQKGETTNPFDFKGPSKKYFNLFCLTKYYAHKNIEAIVNTFDKHRSSLENFRCYITIHASQHKKAGKLLSDIKRKRLDNQIINLGPIPQDKLSAYFLHCDGLILPSLLESFSGTYLEAMFFKCPIITSDLDFAHEVCGDGAMYFNPWSTDSILEAILKLKNDENYRKKIVKAGGEQIGQFYSDWRTIVDNAASDIESIL